MTLIKRALYLHRVFRRCTWIWASPPVKLPNFNILMAKTPIHIDILHKSKSAMIATMQLTATIWCYQLTLCDQRIWKLWFICFVRRTMTHGNVGIAAKLHLLFQGRMFEFNVHVWWSTKMWGRGCKPITYNDANKMQAKCSFQFRFVFWNQNWVIGIRN